MAYGDSKRVHVISGAQVIQATQKVLQHYPEGCLEPYDRLDRVVEPVAQW